MGVAGPVNRVRGMLESLNCDGRRGLLLLGAAAWLLLLPLLRGRGRTPGAALRPRGARRRAVVAPPHGPLWFT